MTIAVVGAGAAGLMAAIQAARAGAGGTVIALDGARTPGAKILVSGGGRCNVTHHAVDETAFAGSTIGVWMILMALLGGSGTLAGPIVGAVVFQITKELFWTYLLGWQRVALGLLIVAVAVFFPSGIVGFVRERFAEKRPGAAEEGQ